MKSDSSAASTSSPVAAHQQRIVEQRTPTAAQREAMETERANEEEDKYRVWLFHSGFCCHFAVRL